MTSEELQTLIASNAQAIRALGDYVSKVNLSVETLSRQTIDFQREVNRIERRMDDTIDEIRDMRADMRELQIENNRILRYLERQN